jgi:hypothetical protein
MPQQPPHLNYRQSETPSRVHPLLLAARTNPITATFIGAVLVVNFVLAALAIPGTVLVGQLLSPGVNWLLAIAGIVSLAWVWSRSTERVFAIHGVCAIALPYLCNLAVWKVACLAYPH